MRTELFALFVSFVSLLVAALALGWNIYRDVILKARVVVRVAVVHMHGERGREGTYINISATNHGPGRVILSGIIGRQGSLVDRWLRRVKHIFVTPDFRNPYSAELPCTLDVGEKADFLLPWREGAVLSLDLRKLGISDTFGRKLWAPAADVERAKADYREAFPPQSAEPAHSR